MGGKDITFHDIDFIYDGFSMLLTNMETHTYGESVSVSAFIPCIIQKKQ